MLVFPSKLPQHSDSQQGDSACGRGHYTKSSRVLTQGCRAAPGDRAPQTQAAWLRGALSHCPPPSPPFVPVRIRNLIHNFKSEEAEVERALMLEFTAETLGYRPLAGQEGSEAV